MELLLALGLPTFLLIGLTIIFITDGVLNGFKI